MICDFQSLESLSLGNVEFSFSLVETPIYRGFLLPKMSNFEQRKL